MAGAARTTAIARQQCTTTVMERMKPSLGRAGRYHFAPARAQREPMIRATIRHPHPGGRMTPDERQIHALLDQWRERTAPNELYGILELMADDAVFLTCGQEPMTKAGFAAASRAMAGKVHFA